MQVLVHGRNCFYDSMELTFGRNWFYVKQYEIYDADQKHVFLPRSQLKVNNH